MSVDWFIAGGWLQLGSLTSIVAYQLMGTSQVYIVALLRWPAIYHHILAALLRLPNPIPSQTHGTKEDNVL